MTLDRRLVELPTAGLKTGRIRFVTVGVGSLLIAAADARRCTIGFTAIGTGPITITQDNPAILGKGWQIYINSPGFKFCDYDWGQLPSQNWYAIGTNAADAVGIAEAYYVRGTK